MDTQQKIDQIKQFPPVVSVLGHVDHGKTSLLDSIRKTSIASREKGGITQKIGASEIEILHEGKKRWITFIDTPGHEAFANMRSQGVNAADIALLIIAADDGIKPQTQESIQKILESKVPFIVVFTKSDLETANVERVKQQLLKEGIMLEGYGGNVPSISVSSKSGLNIQELLDLIVLVYDMSEIKKDTAMDFMGVVIDAKIDKRRGITASIIVKAGAFAVGQRAYLPGREVGKVRALFNTNGVAVKEIHPGQVAEILGIEEVLPTGALLFSHETELFPVLVKEAIIPQSTRDLAIFFGEKKKDVLPIIIKAETSGELDAIKSSLPEKTEIVSEGKGDISVTDILIAKDFHALVLGFNVAITKDAKAHADTEKVFYRLYTIIYELLDEVKEAIEGLIEEDTSTGLAQIMARFEGNDGAILGIKVTDGKIAVNDKITLIRGKKEIGEARIVTLKKGKQDAREAHKSAECGIQITPALDFIVGDMILSHK